MSESLQMLSVHFLLKPGTGAPEVILHNRGGIAHIFDDLFVGGKPGSNWTSFSEAASSLVAPRSCVRVNTPPDNNRVHGAATEPLELPGSVHTTSTFCIPFESCPGDSSQATSQGEGTAAAPAERPPSAAQCSHGGKIDTAYQCLLALRCASLPVYEVPLRSAEAFQV